MTNETAKKVEIKKDLKSCPHCCISLPSSVRMATKLEDRTCRSCGKPVDSTVRQPPAIPPDHRPELLASLRTAAETANPAPKPLNAARVMQAGIQEPAPDRLASSAEHDFNRLFRNL